MPKSVHHLIFSPIGTESLSFTMTNQLTCTSSICTSMPLLRPVLGVSTMEDGLQQNNPWSSLMTADTFLTPVRHWHSTCYSGANTPDKRLPELHHQQPVILDPLFLLDSMEKPPLLTRPVQHNLSVIQHVLLLSGNLCINFSGHSFRIGAATSASRKGIPEHIMRPMGRWSSQTIHRYIRSDLKDLRSAQSHLKWLEVLGGFEGFWGILYRASPQRTRRARRTQIFNVFSFFYNKSFKRILLKVWSLLVKQQYELLKEDRSSVEMLESSSTSSRFSEIRKSRTKHDLAEQTGEWLSNCNSSGCQKHSSHCVHR